MERPSLPGPPPKLDSYSQLHLHINFDSTVVHTVKPGSVVFLKADRKLPCHVQECILEHWKDSVVNTVLENVKVILLVEGLEVELVEKD